jgi:hypothetical protein
MKVEKIENPSICPSMIVVEFENVIRWVGDPGCLEKPNWIFPSPFYQKMKST